MICRYRIYAKALMFAQLLTKLLWALSLIQKWKWKGYYETGIQFLRLNINSSLPKNDEQRLIARECNPSLIRVSESKQEISNLDRDHWNDTILFGKFRINIAEEIDTILKSHYMKICGRILKVYFPIFAKLSLWSRCC